MYFVYFMKFFFVDVIFIVSTVCS